MLLNKVHGFIFEAYAVLFDTANATTSSCEKKFPEKGHLIAKSWFKRTLKYCWLTSLMQQEADLWDVIIRSLRVTLTKFHLQATDADIQEMAQSFLDLDLYEDALPVLTKLKQLGKTSLILSDGTPSMLNHLVQKGNLKEVLNEGRPSVSAQEINFFKPHTNMYAAATATLGLDMSQVAYVTGSEWDAAGARSAGFSHVFLLCRLPAQHFHPDEFGKELTPTYKIEALNQMLEILMGPDTAAHTLPKSSSHQPSIQRGKYATIQVESSFHQPHQHSTV